MLSPQHQPLTSGSQPHHPPVSSSHQASSSNSNSSKMDPATDMGIIWDRLSKDLLEISEDFDSSTSVFPAAAHHQNNHSKTGHDHRPIISNRRVDDASSPTTPTTSDSTYSTFRAKGLGPNGPEAILGGPEESNFVVGVPWMASAIVDSSAPTKSHTMTSLAKSASGMPSSSSLLSRKKVRKEPPSYHSNASRHNALGTKSEMDRQRGHSRLNSRSGTKKVSMFDPNNSTVESNAAKHVSFNLQSQLANEAQLMAGLSKSTLELSALQQKRREAVPFGDFSTSANKDSKTGRSRISSQTSSSHSRAVAENTTNIGVNSQHSKKESVVPSSIKAVQNDGGSPVYKYLESQKEALASQQSSSSLASGELSLSSVLLSSRQVKSTALSMHSAGVSGISLGRTNIRSRASVPHFSLRQQQRMPAPPREHGSYDHGEAVGTNQGMRAGSSPMELVGSGTMQKNSKHVNPTKKRRQYQPRPPTESKTLLLKLERRLQESMDRTNHRISLKDDSGKSGFIRRGGIETKRSKSARRSATFSASHLHRKSVASKSKALFQTKGV